MNTQILRIKDDSVNLVGLVPQMVLALYIAHTILSQQGKDTVITSGFDGIHALTSLHYDGRAADLRSRWYYGKPELVDLMKDALGLDFDVLLENEGESNEHFHIEYQPRRRG